jgi:hypothetical protein
MRKKAKLRGCQRSARPLAQSGKSACLTVVASLGLHALRFAQRSSASARDGRQAIEQRHELGRVVTVCTSQNGIQRRAVSVDDEEVLAARLAPISRVGASFFPYTPPAPTNCRQSRAKNQSGWRGAARPAARDAACPRPRPSASREPGTSRSCPSRSPFPWAAVLTAGLIAG